MLIGFKHKSSNPHHSIIQDVSTKLRLIKLVVILFALLLLHIGAMIFFEGLPLEDAVWLTMTSATTVGYGDLSAKTLEGRVSTVILLYIGGIAILAQVAAMYFEYRQELRDSLLSGDWSWKMENHIVFLNCPEEEGEEYFYQAISGLRKSSAEIANLPIIIVSEKFKGGLSHRLRKLNVVHVSKSPSNKENLEAACVGQANTIVIPSKDQLDPTSDSINFELVYRLREMGVKARIVVEAVNDGNRDRLKKIGADNVLRPIRTYPELLMRAILAPGSEQVIETLFDSSGEECIRYEISLNLDWFEIIKNFAKFDLGIPIAYEDAEGNIFNCPSSRERVNTAALFVLVNQGRTKSNDEIKKIMRVCIGD